MQTINNDQKSKTRVVDEYRSLQALVISKLREDILSGVYKENERLRQDVIASKLGVSKPPVREALGRLEVEGLVTFRPRYGVYVNDISLTEIEELFCVRLIIEGYAIIKAVENITEENIINLEKISQEIENNIEDTEKWVEYNRQFHLLIYESSGNKTLNKITRMLWEKSERYFRLDLTDSRRRIKAIGEHRKILNACKNKDAFAAETELKHHIESTKMHLQNILNKKLSKQSDT